MNIWATLTGRVLNQYSRKTVLCDTCRFKDPFIEDRFYKDFFNCLMCLKNRVKEIK